MRRICICMSVLGMVAFTPSIATAQDDCTTVTDPDGSATITCSDQTTYEKSKTMTYEVDGEDFGDGSGSSENDSSSVNITPEGQTRFPYRPGFGRKVGGRWPIANQNQTDPRWANKPFGGIPGAGPMKGTACGACAVAMALNTLKGTLRYNCYKIAKKYKVVWQGSISWWGRGVDYIKKAGQDAGLKVYMVGRNLSLARRAVQHGAVAVVLFAPGHFTHHGHYLDMTGASRNGFWFADPWETGQFGFNNESHPFKADFLRNQGLFRIWIFQK